MDILGSVAISNFEVRANCQTIQVRSVTNAEPDDWQPSLNLRNTYILNRIN